VPGRARRIRRAPFPGLLASFVLVSSLAVVGFLRLSKEVTLVIDGRARTVGTMASSVADLLADQAVAVDRHDRVTPGPATSLADGMEVQVLLAKEITLLLDGAQRTVYVTGGKTVQDVLEQVNLRTSRHAYLEPSRGATIEDGDVIVYEPAVGVTLTADGKTRDVVTNADDVGYLLDSLGVVLRKRDRVEPDIDTPLEQGLAVTVVRVDFKQVAVDQSIPYRTEIQKTDDLMLGLRRVARNGVPGVLEKTYQVKLANGVEVGRKLLSTHVARDPVSQIVLEGTRPPHTESGVASWYARTGMVAAHKTLPFGTQVKVTSLASGRSVVVVINDRGPYLDGRIIDLSDDAFAQLAPLGTGTINVRIAW
jgi:resuscitation-promoting factor RpfB